MRYGLIRGSARQRAPNFKFLSMYQHVPPIKTKIIVMDISARQFFNIHVLGVFSDLFFPPEFLISNSAEQPIDCIIVRFQKRVLSSDSQHCHHIVLQPQESYKVATFQCLFFSIACTRTNCAAAITLIEDPNILAPLF